MAPNIERRWRYPLALETDPQGGLLVSGFGLVIQATRRGINGVTAKLTDQNLFQRAHESLEDTLKELKDIVVHNTPIARGVTTGNIYYDIQGTTLADLNGIVASPDDWFPALEYGRRAGARMPPQVDIEEWMAAVGIEQSAQFVIRRAIARRGLPALHIMRNALGEGRSHFSTIWFKRFLAEWGHGGSPSVDP